MRGVRLCPAARDELAFGLTGIKHETILLDLDRYEVADRPQAAVQKGEMESHVLAMLDGAGIPFAVLTALGYETDTLRKAEMTPGSVVRKARAQAQTGDSSAFRGGGAGNSTRSSGQKRDAAMTSTERPCRSLSRDHGVRRGRSQVSGDQSRGSSKPCRSSNAPLDDTHE